MSETIIAGLPIPSASPLFLAVVGVHVAFGALAVISGAMAMLSPKRAGRHPRFGTAYVWALGGVAATAAGLAAVRWAEDRALFGLAVLAFGSALAGREARRRLRPGWARLHIVGMGFSYIAMLTAFYVDNGKALPVWRELSPLAYWFGPALIGLPIVAATLARHPLARGTGGRMRP